MINRRDFIRTSVLAGGALFAQTAIPSGAADFLQGHGGSIWISRVFWLR